MMKKMQKKFVLICHISKGDNAAMFTYFNVEEGIQTVLQWTQQATILKNINHEAEYPSYIYTQIKDVNPWNETLKF